MRLILIRHGRTSSNVGAILDTAVPGAPLDETGLAQADLLVGRLSAHPIDAVYASDLTRSQQTAAPLAAARRLEVTILPGLREVSAGVDEGTVDNATVRYTDMVVAWQRGQLDALIPGGETGVDFFRRYDAAIAQIAAAGQANAALVSHGAALRTWCGRRIQGFAESLGERHWLDNTGYVVADGDPASGWTMAAIDGVHEE